MNILQNHQIPNPHTIKTDTYIFEFISVHSDEKHAIYLKKECNNRNFSFRKQSSFVLFFVLPNTFICTLHNFPFMIESFKMNFGDESNTFGL